MKKNLRKLTPHLLAFAICFLIGARSVFAGPNGDSTTIDNPLGGSGGSLQTLFNNIVTIFIEMGTIVSVLAIMYGGFMYVTAQGNEEKLSSAQKTITWALVGTAVLLGARTIQKVITSTVTELSK